MLNMQSLSSLVLDPRYSRRRVTVGPVRGQKRHQHREGEGLPSQFCQRLTLAFIFISKKANRVVREWCFCKIFISF